MLETEEFPVNVRGLIPDFRASTLNVVTTGKIFPRADHDELAEVCAVFSRADIQFTFKRSGVSQGKMDG